MGSDVVGDEACRADRFLQSYLVELIYLDVGLAERENRASSRVFVTVMDNAIVDRLKKQG